MNEATARIKINKLLEAAGWRFFAEGDKPANICLEPGVTIKQSDFDAFGDNFEKTRKGFIDFLLLDAKGFPLIVLEAKAEDKNPLVGKEQARKYARSLNCRFVILSNANLHYFWDLERGNPYIITTFPTPDSVAGYRESSPDPTRLVQEQIRDDYIVLTQRPNYASEAAWKNKTERPGFLQANRLRLLRPYQLKAIHALQHAVQEGSDRFLFEMATGTGKTLTAAAVIKLLLRSGNARRVLFLVDRLELEEQARKVFAALLSADFQTVIYKEKRDDWRRAEIVVSTVQSLLFNNKYQRLFSPTDFDLVISDEAHRSIGGNARAVFDYFVGYKLGLTATPRDYLRGFGPTERTLRDPREAERRLLMDTYRTFGCESGQPTFRYSLLDGVRDGFLINPTVVDARTEVTTQLLSEEGFVVSFSDDSGEDQHEAYKQREFEKRFFSEATNQLFCKTFLENALRDPVSGEIGKSIIFAVSQNHAAKLTQILNQIADRMFPGKYRSDFAVQVTSQISDAQQFTINFANNNLLGSGSFLPDYKTSKARICVTVGMMTTGYDCTDILNLVMLRPIFSPTDFVQIKGRGTRRHNFLEQLFDEDLKDGVIQSRTIAFRSVGLQIRLFAFLGWYRIIPVNTIMSEGEASVPVPAQFRDRLSLPLISAPMFLVSGPELVIETCKCGVIGAFPTANCRTVEQLDDWFIQIDQQLSDFRAAHPDLPVAPPCANLIVHRSNSRLRADLDLVRKHRIELVIASVGSPHAIIEPIHDYGGVVYADVATLRHVEKAVAAGSDGLILLTAGAGGQTGWANPFAFVRQVREVFDGPVVLAGGVADGTALYAAKVLGCDLAYMGTRFIATRESMAPEAYKQMIVGTNIDGITLTKAFSGLETNMIRQSIEAAGLDPDNLPERGMIDVSKDLDPDNQDKQRYRDIWSAGHTAGSIHDIPLVRDLVARLREEYQAARAKEGVTRRE